MPTTETRDDRSGAEVAGGRAAGNGRSQRADHGPDPLRGGELSDPLQCEGGGPGIVPETAAEGASGPGGKLPFFSLLQSSFGEHDLSGARAHTGPEARQATGDLAAKGYTSGSDVVLDAGADLHTVAHEAAHYVQQQQGVQLYGGIGKPGDPWERHADAVADAVVAGQPAGPVLDAMPGGAAGGVQLKGTGEAKTNESLISKLLEQIMSQISEPYSGQREEIEQQAREQSSEDSTLDTAVAWLEQQRDQGRLKNIGGVDVRMEKLTELYDRQRQLKVRLGDVPSIEEVSSWRQEALDLSVDEPTLVKSEELLQKRIEEAGPRTEGLVALDLALDGLGKLESSFELDTRNSKAALAVEGSNGDLMAAARLVETWTTTREQELKRPVEELGGKIKGEYGKQRVTRTGQRQAPPKDESVDVHVNDALKLSPDLRDTTEAQGALQQRLDTAQGDTAKMEKIDKLIDDLAPFYNGQEKWKNTRLTKALQSGDLGSAISNLEQDLENKIKEKKKPVLDLVGRLGQEAKKQQVIPWLARPALSDEAVLGVEKEAFELSPNLMDLSAAKKHVTERLQRETAETGWLRDISDQVVVMARLHSELEEGQQEGWATSALSEAGSLKDAVGLMKKRVEDRKLELMRPFDEQISQIGQEHEKQRNLTTRMKKPPEESQLVSLKSQAEKKLGGNYLDLSKGTEFLSQSLQTAQQDTMTMTEVSERIEAFAELSPEFGETERQQLLTEARGSHKSRRKDNELGPWLQEEKERRKKKLVEPLESLVKLVIAEREKQEKYNDLA
ncbi:MAG TPA: DUF4157 domain-containing protein, partial [Myxococcota bacterium]|nr:DUF4157 domain-containing protein [Myxococcota bacterium]